MGSLAGSLIVIWGSWQLIRYVGPPTLDNEYLIFSVLLWFVMVVTALKLIVDIVTLPFPRRK